MSLPSLDQITAFDSQGLAMLQKILDTIRAETPPIRYTTTVPTAATTQLREFVVYDDGAGTKRIYVKTGQNNLGYVNLT